MIDSVNNEQVDPIITTEQKEHDSDSSTNPIDQPGKNRWVRRAIRIVVLSCLLATGILLVRTWWDFSAGIWPFASYYTSQTEIYKIQPIADPEKQALAFESLAKSAIRFGQLNAVFEALEKFSDPHTKFQAYIGIYRAAAETGQLDHAKKALGLAFHTTDDLKEAEAPKTYISYIITLAAQNRHFEFALEEIQNLNPSRLPSAYDFLAKSAIKQNQFRMALSAADKIPPYGSPHSTYSFIAQVMGDQGQLDQLSKMVNGATDPYRQANAYSAIAKEMTRLGQQNHAREAMDLALNLALQIQDLDQLTSAYTSMAPAIISHRYWDGLVKHTNKVENLSRRHLANLAVASHLASQNDLASALEIVGLIADPDSMLEVCALILEKHLPTSSLQQAEEIIVAVKNPLLKVAVYASLAKLVVNTGQIKQTKKIIASALNQASQITDPHAMIRVHTVLAPVMEDSGQFQEARNAVDLALVQANKISDLESQIRAYATIAKAAANINRLPSLFEAAERLTISPDAKKRFRATIAQSALQASSPKMVLEAIGGLADHESRFDAYSGLAPTRPYEKMDFPHHVYKSMVLLTAGIPDATREFQAQSHIYAGLAKTAEKTGHLKAILDAANYTTEYEFFKTIPNQDIMNLLPHIYKITIPSLVDAKKIPMSLEMASKITQPNLRRVVYYTIVNAAVKANQLETAVQAADQISKDGPKSQLLATIVPYAANLGRADLANKLLDSSIELANKIPKSNLSNFQAETYSTMALMAGQIQNRDLQARAYATITEAAAKVNQLDAVLEGANLLVSFSPQPNPSDGLAAATRFYETVAPLLIKTNQVHFGLKAANANRYPQLQTYQTIIQAAANAGQFDSMFELDKQLIDPNQRIQFYAAMMKVALERGETGAYEKIIPLAINQFNSITDMNAKAETISNLAPAMIKANQFNELLKLVSQFENSYQKITCYINIVRASKKVNQLDLANRAIDLALNEASGTTEGFKIDLCLSIADSALSIDQIETAKKAVLLAINFSNQTRPNIELPRIISTALRTNQIEAVLDAAKKINNPILQAETYESMIYQVTGTNQVNTLVEKMALPPYSMNQNFLSLTVAESTNDRSQLRPLLPKAQKITDPVTQSQFYTAIVEAAERTNDLELANQAIELAFEAISKVADPVFQANTYLKINQIKARIRRQ